MRKLGWVLLVLLVVGLGITWVFWPKASPPAEVVAPASPPVEPRGRLADPPQAELLAEARQALGSIGRRESCGPYPLWTDVTEPRLIAACGRLASELDELYAERYGIRPRGAPASSIVLFSKIASYRTFASESGVPLGYAGYALGARGLAIFYYASDQPFEAFLKTLAHELTHLLNRRALGVNLPPWLSEGLADGIGDTATSDGFRPLVGVRGSEAQASRLREAYASRRAGGVARLVALSRDEFDDGAVSFDYEQSALLVRFVLSQPDLASGFQIFLSDFAAGAIYSSERLAGALDVSLGELDRRFSAWVESSG